MTPRPTESEIEQAIELLCPTATTPPPEALVTTQVIEEDTVERLRALCMFADVLPEEYLAEEGLR